MTTSTPPKRVLLFEDDDDIRDLLSRLLISYGCEPVIATTAKDVESIITDNTVELALLDIMVPGEDGREVARSFRQDGLTFPVYFMTGLHNAINQEERELVEGVLYKPFTVSELRAVLDETVGRPGKTSGTVNEQQALELMTAVATEHESLHRQQEQLDELKKCLHQNNCCQDSLDMLERFSARYGASLNHLGALLEDMRNIFENNHS